MVSHVPIYPYSCNPDDIMAAEDNGQRFFFCTYVDIIQDTLKEFERQGYDIGMEEGDTE